MHNDKVIAKGRRIIVIDNLTGRTRYGDNVNKTLIAIKMLATDYTNAIVTGEVKLVIIKY